MKVKVFAKVNLTLSVGARQGEFHPIDSVVTSVDVCDTVEVAKRCDNEITVKGVAGVEQQRNTAYLAAVAFVNTFLGNLSNCPLGVDISVQKGIPFGAGMGGSSADAAAVVYCMCKLFDVDVCSDAVHQLCARLGSDVNYMLHGGLARMQGKGDDVAFYKAVRPLYFALTTFDLEMRSGEIYCAYDSLPIGQVNESDKLLIALQQGALDNAVALLTNDLQRATASVSDYAKRYLDFIKLHNWHCNMTGSGSAYYVACATRKQAQGIADTLNDNGFATVVCRSVPNGIVEI